MKNYKIEKILANEYGKAQLREALKSTAEEAKISISPPSKFSADICTYKPLGEDDDGNEMEIDMKMSLEEYEKAVAPIFQRAIDISKKLVEKNNLKTQDLEMVLLVGGPTLSQTMRRMLRDELKTNIDTSIDPMTSVAVGASLFASSKNIPADIQERDKEKIQLILHYPGNTVETEENLGIKIDRAQTTGQIPEKIFVEISRKDKGWSSGKVEIQDDSEIVSVLLTEGKSNGFDISIFDDKGTKFQCEPDSISIIQGFKEPPATLPFGLCIEAFTTDADKKMMSELQGLGKNQSLPARGKGSFKTQKDIRPGNPDDKIKIPIYEGDPNTRAVYNKFVAIAIITGDDLPKFLPKGSEIEISIEVNKSRGISLKIYFPDIDETVEKDWNEAPKDTEEDANELEAEIKNAMATLSKLETESATIDDAAAKRIRQELEELAGILMNGRSDFNTKTKVKDRLCGVLKDLDNLEELSLFPKVEEELREALDDLKNNQERYGTTQTIPAVEQFEKIAASVIKEMNVLAAKDLITQIKQFSWALVDQGAGVALDISYIKNFDDHFESYAWKNRGQARELINQAKGIIAQNPTRGRLRPIIQEIWQLVPDKEKAVSVSNNDDEYLSR
jgi:molecular chaperone DnaK